MTPDQLDAHWMRRALDLARRALGETNPNPAVGCVIVRDGEVVGQGHHRRAGGPHAEVVALEAAGEGARGATLYVNLEPCAHHGRTPPCAPRLVSAGLRRVVAAIRDPHPRVRGRGLALLREAGIEVATGTLESEALLLNEPFLVAARSPRPFVLLKAGLTLDGRIATARRDARWVTGPRQRQEARALRRLYDGVLVGIGTVLADDPMLLPRPHVLRPFHRIVVDSHLRLPLRSRLVRSAREAPVWVLAVRGQPRRRRALEARGVRVLESPSRRGRVSLAWALRALREAGLWSLMVEGGSEVLGSFLAERLFDQVALFRAPVLLGGRGSLPAFGGPDPARVKDALRLTPVSPLLRQAPVAAAAMASGPLGGLSCEVWYPRR